MLIFYFLILPFLGAVIASPLRSETQIYLWTYSINLFPSIDIFDDLSHFWTLAVEEHFYLLWPIIIKIFIKLFHRKNLLTLCLAILVVSTLTRYFLFYKDFTNIFIFHFSLSCFDSLALGAALADLKHRGILAKYSRN